MGRKVHVAKRYIIEWGDCAAFNWGDETFIDLLKALGADAIRDCEYSDDFEVIESEYYDAIENLRVYISDPQMLTERDYIAEGLNKLGITAEELLDTMHRYWEEADIHDGWLHFTSF